MNLISPPKANPSVEATVRSLQDWWSLAGVDLDFEEQPSALLSPKATAPIPAPSQSASATKTLPKEPAPPVPIEPMPAGHEDFIAWLASDKNLIEAGWSRNRVLPEGVLEPEIMVISALPEKGPDRELRLFNSENQTLLNRMLAAIGCDSQNYYLATIALSCPVEGRIDEQHWQPLKTRLLHHIGLVRPKRLICFGDLAAKIIFDEDLLTARKNKQFINQGSSKLEAIVTFHPRILIERPLFKTEAWKDLQMLTRISKS